MLIQLWSLSVSSSLQWNGFLLLLNQLKFTSMGNAQDAEQPNTPPPPPPESEELGQEGGSHDENASNYFDAGGEDCKILLTQFLIIYGGYAFVVVVSFFDAKNLLMSVVTSYFPKQGKLDLEAQDEDMSGIRGTYFRDGARKIDYVLVYTEEENKPTDPKHLRFRTTFLNNLKKCAVDTEMEISDDRGTKIHFIKCHCPFEVLRDYAEELAFKAPLERRDTDRINWSERILAKAHLPNPFHQDVPNPPADYFTATFRADKFHIFIGSEEPETYFSDVERTRVCHELLETAPYGKKRRGEIGIERLVEEGVFTAAYPLHAGPYKIPKEEVPEMAADDSFLNDRQLLTKYWGNFGKWIKYQPLHHIRAYFGEQIGLYFAWLGQYTAWLLLPSFVGLCVFLYGCATINSTDNFDAIDICESGETYKMCPRCDEQIGCKYWYLSDSCFLAKTSYLFDNAATVVFSVFVSFWAVFFLEFWKRKEVTLAYQWDCLDYESEVERPRPAFAALAPIRERNPITGAVEPHFPEKDRDSRLYSGILIIISMIMLVLIFMFGVIIYKSLVYRPLNKHPLTSGPALQIANITGGLCNLSCIMILSKVYEKVALALTQWEMHRTQTEYEKNLIFKLFIFQFVNYYASIFYIAFLKGRFVGYPGNYLQIFELRMEECGPGGCLIELAQQLVIIMVGKQAFGNIKEVMIPVIKKKLKARGKPVKAAKPRWEDDYELFEDEGLRDEYLEMVIQFGFITIFVVAFPLAPFFALANNIFEIRIDSSKLMTVSRRPIAHRAQDLGIWLNILDAIGKIAVISNAFLIAFTTKFLPKLLYRSTISPDGSLTGYVNFSLAVSPVNSTTEECRYRDFRDPDGNLSRFYWHLLALKLGFVIVFEHFVFATHRLIDIFVPNVPEELDIVIKKELYLARKAFSEHPMLDETSEDELSNDKIDVRAMP